MPNFQNSIVYKLCHCNDLENKNIYIGSSTNFRRRKWEHKSRTNNERSEYYSTFVYQFIRDNGGWNEWVMIPIEVFPCNDKDELKIRERYHIELLKSKLNKNIPTRTDKEYRDDNKERLIEYKKNWCKVNKERLIEYYEANKEQILEYQKEYRNANKEKMAEYFKKYREDNQEKINEERNKKVICDHCGCELNKSSLKIHKKTNKCINFVK